MNLTFRQIECFRHVMLLESTVAAADALRISQSSVSRAITKLEEEVGFNLFTRDGNRMKPTHDADVLYQAVARTIDGLTEIGRTARAIQSRRLGRIRIICLPALLETTVAKIVGEFALRHPDLRFEIEMGGMARVMEEVGKGRFELGIGAPPGDSPEVRSVVLDKRPVCAVAPKGLKIGRDGVVSWSELARHRMIVLLPGSPFRERIDRQFEALSLAPNFVIEACTQQAALQLVRAGAGVSLVDAKCVASEEIKKDVQTLELDAPMFWESCLIFPRHELPSHAISTFIQFLRRSTESSIRY